MMLQVGFVDGPTLHLISAITCSAVAAVVGSPVDVVKTHAMANINDLSKVSYSGIVKTIYEKEGARAFYKGLDAFFFRLSVWNSIMFLTLEQIKRFYYSPTLDD